MTSLLSGREPVPLGMPWHSTKGVVHAPVQAGVRIASSAPGVVGAETCLITAKYSLR